MSTRAAILLAVLAASGPALAQSSPPDLQPKLTGGPLTGRPANQTDKPRLQEPPRPPVARDTSALSTSAPATPPSR